MILDKDAAAKKIYRMAMEIAERHYSKNEIVLIGIKENGFFIAQKIAASLQKILKAPLKHFLYKLIKNNPAKYC